MFSKKSKCVYGIVMRGNTNILCGKAYSWKEAVRIASRIEKMHFLHRVAVYPLKTAESICQQTRLPF